MDPRNDTASNDSGGTAKPASEARRSDTYPQDFGTPYRDTTIHDEDGAVKHGARLSGSNYVPVQLRDYHGKPDKVLVKPRQWCNHGVTICRDCADSWALDHIIYYERTKAGRLLLDQVDTDQKQRAATQVAPTDTVPEGDASATDSPATTEHRPPAPGIEGDDPRGPSATAEQHAGARPEHRSGHRNPAPGWAPRQA
ncbi:hypothetical protein [Nocardia wallacei]|uniref:hypothetical protein n=1 Tax=Nocardia wallacei TaxID=480035 RepID=UPI00245845F4|nr:hypothetical protein [Nocardia wallacei]